MADKEIEKARASWERIHEERRKGGKPSNILKRKARQERKGKREPKAELTFSPAGAIL